MTYDIKLSNSSYDKFGVDPSVLHDVNGLLYPYDTTWTNIGVNLSGGADSAVGTATLCKLILEHETTALEIAAALIAFANNKIKETALIKLLDNALSIGEELQQDKKVLINTVPSSIRSLIESGIRLDNATVINLAGEPFPIDVAKKLLEIKADVRIIKKEIE